MNKIGVALLFVTFILVGCSPNEPEDLETQGKVFEETLDNQFFEAFEKIETSNDLVRSYPNDILPLFQVNYIEISTLTDQLSTVSYNSKLSKEELVKHYKEALSTGENYQYANYQDTTWIYGEIQSFYFDVMIYDSDLGNNSSTVYISALKEINTP